MANQADVRVRLSAEGQAEVIAAFQKVALEGKKSAKDTGAAFADLNKQFKEVGATLLGGLGIALVAEKFAAFFKHTLEGAEGMTRLSKQTGLSTDAIQAFARAARETGVQQEAVNAGIAKFTTQIGKAEIGSKQSAAALSDLGLSVKAIASLSADQRLLAVAEALAAIQDPARRARIEVGLFGRAGVELDQALVKVGTEGFAPFIKHLRDLGIFLDTETIRQLKGAQESMRTLGDEVKGLATQFLVGLVPALTAAGDSLAKATTGEGVSGFKTLGTLVGNVLSAILFSLEAVGKGIAATVARVTSAVSGLVGAAGKAIHGNFAAAAAELRAGAERDTAIIEAYAADIKGTFKDLFGEKPKAAEAPAAATDTGAEGARADALAKARLALLTARLESELKLYEAHARLLEAADKQLYDEGEITLKEYYARRARIISDELDKQIATAKAKRAAEAALTVDINDPVAQINQRTQLARLDGEIALLQVKRAADLAANTNAEALAQEKLYRDTIRAEETLLTIEGRRADAARLKLGVELEALDVELRKAGVPAADRSAAEATFGQQGLAKIDFTEKTAEAVAALSQLDSARKQIQNQVRDGELFSIDAAQRIVQLDRDRLPALQAQAEELLVLAHTTGDAMDVAKAEAYKEKIDQIAASTNQLGVQTAQVRAGIENAIGSGINKFLTDAVSGTKNLKSAFRDMALSILADLEKIAIKLLEEEALKAIFGAAGGGGSGGLIAGVIGAFAGGAATGGQVRGPGTSKSDSIPIMVSDKEFVVNAESATQPGVLPLLQAINAGQLRGVGSAPGVPKFAAGGQVGGAAAGPAIKLVNVLDPTALGDHLATAAGERAVLNVIARNPGKIRSSLG